MKMAWGERQEIMSARRMEDGGGMWHDTSIILPYGVSISCSKQAVADLETVILASQKDEQSTN